MGSLKQNHLTSGILRNACREMSKDADLEAAIMISRIWLLCPLDGPETHFEVLRPRGWLY